ncbi:MAG: iron transporter permease [Enterovirga sp.]|nr:iron transporter permease [Enterovirga sp.]
MAAPLLSLVASASLGGSDALAALAASVLPDALRQTVLLLLGVAVFAGSMGTVTAWLVTAFRYPGSRALAWLLPLPMAVPTYVTALVYVELLDAAGPVRSGLRQAFGRGVADVWFPEIRSLPGCVLLLSFVLYPYIFVAVRASFLAREPSILAAARTLGCRPWTLFRRIALPLARPALAAGTALALLEALNDIGASEYLGVRTLTVSAYTAWLERGDFTGAAQIACAALALVALLLLAEAALRDRSGYSGSAAATGLTEPAELTGWRGAAAGVACGLPVLVGFVVPALFLVREVIRRELIANAGPDFTRHLATTILLAAAATVLVVLWAIPIALAARRGRGRITRLLGFVAGLGYAVPGTVLVLGLLGPLIGVDRLLGGVVTAVSGRETGLLLMGSGGALVVGYAIRFLRIGIGGLSAQLAQTPSEIESVARTLGARPLALARRIQLPLLRPALGAAALLVFVDCLKELPATLLLRPLNVETLATLVYGASSRGLFEEGALAALLIVVAGLGPVTWLTVSSRPRTAPARRPAPRAALQAALREPSSATLKSASV